MFRIVLLFSCIIIFFPKHIYAESLDTEQILDNVDDLYRSNASHGIYGSPLQKAKNGRKTRFENDQIWKWCKFRCNGQKFTIYGAKDIYSFQRFQWAYFRIEISTIYPQMKTFVPHVNFIKIAKKWKFQKLYMGWVLTGMSSYA